MANAQNHLAIEVAGENTSNEWLEHMLDSEYAKLEEWKNMGWHITNST